MEENKCSPFNYEYVDKKEKLQPVQDKGFGFSPYDFSFVVTRYPFLFLNAGEGSIRNLQVVNSPHTKNFLSGSIPEDALRIVALGDLMPLKKGDYPSVDEKLSSILERAHIVLMNIESPVVGKQDIDPSDKTTLDFDMKKEFVAKVLQEFHIDNKAIFNVANNHAGDAQLEGLKETVSNLSTLGLVIGAHARVNGNAGLILKLTTHQGVIGIVSWTAVMNHPAKNKDLGVWREEDVLAENWEEVKKKEKIDTLIGFCHWDYEQSYYPSNETCVSAHKLLGKHKFNVIIGHGPHVLQPIETNDDNCVCFYSIGNICSARGSWQTKLGAFCEVSISKGELAGYKLYPFYQSQSTEHGLDLIPIYKLKDYSFRKTIRARYETLFDLVPSLNSKIPTFRVKVKTGEKIFAGTNSNVYIQIHGTHKGERINTDEMHLIHQFRDDFQRGSEDFFFVRPKVNKSSVYFDTIESISVRLEPYDRVDDWYLSHVQLLDLVTGSKWEVPFNEWFKENSLKFQKAALHSFPQPTIVELTEVTNKLKTGDIILYGHNCFKSSLIKLLTQSPYSHVGYLYRDEHGNLLVYESTINDGETPDVVYETPYAGVHLFQLQQRLVTYNGKIWHLPLIQPLQPIQEQKAIAFLKKCHAEKVPFDWNGVIRSCLKFVEEHKSHEGIFASVFGAELVTRAYQESDLISKDIDASKQTPKEVASFDIFEKNALDILKDFFGSHNPKKQKKEKKK